MISPAGVYVAGKNLPCEISNGVITKIFHRGIYATEYSETITCFVGPAKPNQSSMPSIFLR